MQIPVDGGYEDGNLLVLRKTDEHVTSFDFSHKSKRYFFAALFFSDCKHKWQPVKRGIMVAFEYELVWQPCSTSTIFSMELPPFLSAFKLVKEVLSLWVQQPLTGEIEDGEIFSEDESTLRKQTPTKLTTKEKANVSGTSKAPKVTNLDVSKGHLLIIPLNETYYETNLNFTSLHGSDSRAAHILQSIDFIDVHLAIIGASDAGHFQIAQWIYSSASLPQFQKYHLDMEHQLIGQLKPNLVSDGKHAVLVIQPQRQSIHRCCSFQFDSMMVYLESRTLLDRDSKMMRLRSVSCIDNTISFCQESPLEVLNVPTATERILRLLKICKDNQVPQTSLLLIPPLVRHDFGFDKELVARSIAETILNTDKRTYLFFKIFVL